ncbi:MAG: glycosyltransferase [Anaerolineae bacterium]|nr:glycosyltransferase [Anaerolineae bacterium]
MSSSNWPKISIVTPSYQQGPYLEACIRSVLDQGYPNLEYIVMDGGSSDGSADILRQYDGQLAFWASEKDAGQADAINKGFAHATGSIMGWLNSDDTLLPRALERIAHVFMAEPETHVVCGHRKVIDRNGAPRGDFFCEMPVPFVLQRLCVVPQETCYWRRGVYDRIGPLDASLHFALDYEYWQRMLAAGYRFRLIHRFLGGFRLHEESKTSTLDAVRTRELGIIYRRYLKRETTETELLRELAETRSARLPFLKRTTADKLSERPLLFVMLWLTRSPAYVRLMERLGLL